jgi:ABC-type transport system substrate-binding protein
VKDKRPGEELWDHWSGDGYEYISGYESVFFTEGHVDIDNEVVRRALASSLQREGIVDSLREGFDALSLGEVSLGWAGTIDNEIYLTVCDEHGYTPYGDLVDQIKEITWVEFLF